MTCIFCRIAAGELPCHAIYQDDDLLAFLDIRPVRPGHTIVIPRRHAAYFDDVPAPVASRMMLISQSIARALKQQYGVERVAYLHTGTDIAHAHAHLIPMHEVTDVTSGQYLQNRPLQVAPAPLADPADLVRIATQLRAGLAV